MKAKPKTARVWKGCVSLPPEAHAFLNVFMRKFKKNRSAALTAALMRGPDYLAWIKSKKG